MDSDGFTCKSKEQALRPLIVYSTRTELQALDLRGNGGEDESSGHLVRPLVTKLKKAVAVDFYFGKLDEDVDLPNNQEGKSIYFIFWNDVDEDKIFRGTMVDEGPLSDIKTIVENGLTTAKGLAVDWIGQNLYWIDSNLNQIEVATFEGNHRRTLIANKMESPRAIALDAREAIIFWTDWEGGTPQIESCDMSGDPNTRKTLNTISSGEDGSWPNGITIDFVMKR